MTPQEQLDAYENGYQDDLGVGRWACAPRAFEALRVVLKRHHVMRNQYGVEDCSWCCEGWPCLTVQDITTALGETS